MAQPLDTNARPAGWKAYMPWAVNAGLIIIFAATMLALLHIEQLGTWRYIYSAGAVILIVARALSQYKGTVMRVKRLSRIEFWSAIFFCAAAFFMFYPGANNQDWLAFTLAGAAIQVYTSIMIPIALAKATKETGSKKKS